MRAGTQALIAQIKSVLRTRDGGDDADDGDDNDGGDDDDDADDNGDDDAYVDDDDDGGDDDDEDDDVDDVDANAGDGDADDVGGEADEGSARAEDLSEFFFETHYVFIYSREDRYCNPYETNGFGRISTCARGGSAHVARMVFVDRDSCYVARACC